LFYRPPSSCIDIFDRLSLALSSLHPAHFTNFVLLGDFNVNFFLTDSFLYRHLHYSLLSFSLTQVVTSATHSQPILKYIFFVTASLYTYKTTVGYMLSKYQHEYDKMWHQWKLLSNRKSLS